MDKYTDTNPSESVEPARETYERFSGNFHDWFESRVVNANPTFADLLEVLRHSYRITDLGNGKYLLRDDKFTAWTGGVSGYIEDTYGSACLDRFDIRTEPDLVDEFRTVPQEFMREDGPVTIRERTAEQIVTYQAEQRRHFEMAEAAWDALQQRRGAQ
jgi:hypothetical protein